MDALTLKFLPQNMTYDEKFAPYDMSYEERLASFEHGWTGKVGKEALAEAGFYWPIYNYSNMKEDRDDCVFCFYCNVGLNNWNENYDPIAEHLKYSKDCDFIKYYSLYYLVKSVGINK